MAWSNHANSSLIAPVENKLRQSQIANSESGREISYAIRDALLDSKPDDYPELLILSERIKLCNDSANIWTANDLHNSETGELYNGAGRFWCCGSKLCPFCVKRASKKNKKNLRAALSVQRLFVGEDYRFITLTMPRQQMPLLKCRAIMNTAFALFRKRKWFKETIKGGAKSEEFTVNSKGFNYHFHLLARSKYVSFAKLRSEWSECLHLSFAKFGLIISFATSDGLAIVNCKRITSLDDAINEVSKYITKSDSWRKLKQLDLLEIARIRRFPRMFELLGTFKIPKPENAILDLGESAETILDTTTLSDGITDAETNLDWRKQLRRSNPSDYLAKLRDEIRESYFFRRDQLKFKYPFASFRRVRKKFDFSVEDFEIILQKFREPCPICGLKTQHVHYSATDNGDYCRAAHN